MVVLAVTNILRLCGVRRVFLPNKRCRHAQASHGSTQKDFKSLLEENKHKITFNSYLEHEKLELGHFRYFLKKKKIEKNAETLDFKQRSLPPIPIAMHYYVEKDRLLKDEVKVEEDLTEESVFQLPLSPTPVQIGDEKDTKPKDNADEKNEFNHTNINKWMTNYEYYDDTRMSREDNDELDGEWVKQYGTPDPNMRVSSVKCGGCGALFHCSDPAIPGYLPSELYKGRSNSELMEMECQRCHFLKEYNIALDVSVEPEEYEKLLQSIRCIKSLVLLMVDLLDYPCSIWPGIVDIIGTDRPLIIVGNKVDLLPGDSIGYLKRVKESLISEINKTRLKDANIKYVSLISAKTGYGVESLISALFQNWMYKGDVFLVGCTNVGKSSLFNALLQSDYCKAQASDIIKRATVSRWPGTTLNLLKFPINRPSAWKIYTRGKRLKHERKLMKIEKQIRQDQTQGKIFADSPSLISHIGRTFSPYHLSDENILEKQQELLVMNERHKLFIESKWLYDTPGVIHPDQVLSLLSTEELLLTIPKKVIRPQTYYLREGTTLFIAGLARVDIIESPEACRLTIFCSECLPITVTKTEDADEIYKKFLGTELFAAPTGSAERMQNWSGLEKSEEKLEFPGEGPKICCGDVVLSSVGWVSVTAKQDTVAKLEAWTPQARGVRRRSPALLPQAVNLKGKRVQDTPAYLIGRHYVDSKLL